LTDQENFPLESPLQEIVPFPLWPVIDPSEKKLQLLTAQEKLI
jgi:hypothetical protein